MNGSLVGWGGLGGMMTSLVRWCGPARQPGTVLHSALQPTRQARSAPGQDQVRTGPGPGQGWARARASSKTETCVL